MILIINICKEKLHWYEFVKPIEDILTEKRFKFRAVHYKNLKRGDLRGVNKVIICGTSLADDGFLSDVGKFGWLKDFPGAMLGICGGAHLIGLVFGGKLGRKKEIGMHRIKLRKEFLGLNGEKEVYQLHNYYVAPPSFEPYYKNQAWKHRQKQVYAVVFHPEVRQKGLISEFCSL